MEKAITETAPQTALAWTAGFGVPLAWVLCAVLLGLLWGAWRRYRTLRDEVRMLEIALENTNDSVLVQRFDATILWCNTAYCEIFGRPRSFWIGKKPQKWVFPPELCPSDAEIEAFRYDPDGPEFQTLSVFENIDGTGRRFWHEFSLSKTHLHSGEPVVVLAGRDVSEQVKREEKLTETKARLERAVNFDQLTQLANRKYLTEFLEDCLKTADQKQRRVGLLHVDLDKFKEVNDTHGHAAGDAILVHVAKALKGSVRPEDLAARVGGDEFVIVVPNCHGFDLLREISLRVIEAVAEPLTWQGVRLSVKASVGIAFAEPGMSGEELTQNADFALYEAKAAGRGTFSTFDKRLRERHLMRKKTSEELAEALHAGNLEFHYQPIFDFASGGILGLETLARWRHPERGTVPAGEFLSMVEEMGMIAELDLAAMRAAAVALDAVRTQTAHDPYVSFNASSNTLAGFNLIDRLKWETDRLDLPRNRLAVEVLETVFFGPDAADSQVAAQIDAMRSAGFITLLDDFGAGYAGLAHLAQLKVTGIKIDRSIVRGVVEDRPSNAIVRAISSLAAELDLTVITEGVEDDVMAAELRKIGCPAGQGFGFARPMPLADVLAFLRARPVGKTALSPSSRLG